MRALLNLWSSRIELERGVYKLGSVTNGMSIIPRKWWHGPPFIVRRGEGIIVYSLIVVGLYYKGSVIRPSPQVPLGLEVLSVHSGPLCCFGIGLPIRGDRSYPLLQRSCAGAVVTFQAYP
jgi:hypothetical protein